MLSLNRTVNSTLVGLALISSGTLVTEGLSFVYRFFYISSAYFEPLPARNARDLLNKEATENVLVMSRLEK